MGGVVGYTLTLENHTDVPLAAVRITDRPPPAFQLQTDSVQLVRAGADRMLGTPDDLRDATVLYYASGDLPKVVYRVTDPAQFRGRSTKGRPSL